MPPIVARTRVLGRVVPAWEDYINWATEKADESWLFRGQGNVKWPLIPKVGRPDVCGPKGWNLSDEKDMYAEFQKLSRRFEKDLDALSSLALAQHFGVPTRLLDWTTDPLVALWFALNSQEKKSNPVVHAIRVRKGHRFSNVDALEPSVTEVRIINVPDVAARITAQQGCFSVHPQPNMNWDPGAAYPYEIYPFSPVVGKDVLKFLDVFGVTAAKLMADLDGVGKTLAARWARRS